MASGTIYGSTNNQYIDAKIVWSSTAHISENKSTVTATLYYKRNNTGYTTYGSGTFSISINHASSSVTGKSMTITENEWVKAVSASVKISHRDDGTLSIPISASGGITGTSFTSTSVSGTATLDPIPRATTIDSLSCATKYFNGTMTYKYTPMSASYYTRCNIALNINGTYTAVKSISLGQKSASQKTATVTLTADELSTIYNKLPNDTKGILRFTFRTYSDSGYSKQVGDAGYKEITLSIPLDDTTTPTASVTVAPSHSLTGDFASLYIQGKSKVKATITSSGKYGATIKACTMEVEGKTYDSEDAFTSEYLARPGTVNVKVTVTDSRGFSLAVIKNITVIPYSTPKVIPASGESKIICARCDENGNLTDTGTYLKIKAKRSYSKVISGGVQKNFCGLRYRYKKSTDSSFEPWTTILIYSNLNTEEVTTAPLLGGGVSAASSYIVHVDAVDSMGNHTYAEFDIPTAKVYWHKAGSRRSFGFGEYVEEDNCVSIAEDIGVKVKGGFKPVEIPGFTDLNTLTKPNTYVGVYSYTPNYVNCPITVESTFSLEVISMGRDGQLLQRITRCSAEATVYERQYYSQEWHEWECVNPPMVVGEEYRTTERYMGKPVYTKMIYCDELPNTTYKLFPHGATVSQAIRCVGQMSDGNSLPFRFNASNYVEIYAGPENIVIFAGNDKTNRSAYAQMWYVKD